MRGKSGRSEKRGLSQMKNRRGLGGCAPEAMR